MGMNPLPYLKELMFLTDSVKKNSEAVKEQNKLNGEILNRLIALESSFKQKDKDDEKYKDMVDELNKFKYHTMGRLDQASIQNRHSSSPPKILTDNNDGSGKDGDII